MRIGCRPPAALNFFTVAPPFLHASLSKLQRLHRRCGAHLRRAYNSHMCGRFVLHHPSSLLRQWYEAVRVPEMGARYNIAPGAPVHVLRATPQEREIAALRWGFIPSWADDPSCVPMLHNARGETVAEKPMFRQAFRLRRGLIPASGFYEWKTGTGQKHRRPFYLSLRDGAPMSFAAVWDRFAAPDGSTIETCAIVTVKANTLIEPIHHRMPVLLDRAAWPLWLDAATPVATLLALLQPFPAERMQMWEVTDAINSLHADGPALPLPAAASPAGPGPAPALL